MMQHNLVRVGEVGINLAMLVSWEWMEETQFLVIRMLNDTLYLRGQQARALWLLLDTLAAARGRQQGST